MNGGRLRGQAGAAGSKEIIVVSTADLHHRSLIHGHQHALLGVVGKYNQALPPIPIPTLLLGLRGRPYPRNLALGLTLGAMGNTGRPFLADLSQSDLHHIGLAVIGGIIFNVANLLLVAAIDIAGLAVAFPVGIGLALVEAQ